MKSNMMKNVCLIGWNEQAAPTELSCCSYVSFYYKQITPTGATLLFFYWRFQKPKLL